MAQKQTNQKKRRKSNLGFLRGGVVGRGMKRRESRAADAMLEAKKARRRRKSK